MYEMQSDTIENGEDEERIESFLGNLSSYQRWFVLALEDRKARMSSH